MQRTIAERFILAAGVAGASVLATSVSNAAYHFGDVNADGVVDITDALLVAQYRDGIETPWFHRDRANVNCTGIIDYDDAQLIAEYAVGAISEFPCPNPLPKELVEVADKNAQRVYDYYLDQFGRAGLDGKGSVASFVFSDKVLTNAEMDASGSILTFWEADSAKSLHWAYSLDMVAHELTHGVLMHSGLRNIEEMKAVNESFADVMAVFVGAQDGSVNWQIGDDVFTPTVAGDAIRDLADPHAGHNRVTLATCRYDPEHPFVCGQASHMREYLAAANENTEYVNAGILSHAAYLLTMGGVEEGVAVRGIGPRKAAQLYYRTMTRMARYMDFPAVRTQMQLACTEMLGLHGITVSDCQSVANAFDAVGIVVPAAPQSGIQGRVTFHGQPASARVVLEAFVDLGHGGASWGGSDILSADTDADGFYRFENDAIRDVITLLVSIPVTYRVKYQNPDSAPNGRLRQWQSPSIREYDFGSGSTMVPTFDIADLELTGPSDTEVQSLPITFTWNPRGSEREYYRWEHDRTASAAAAGKPVQCREPTTDLHSTPTITLSSSNLASVCSGQLTAVDSWDVVISSPAGVGVSQPRPIRLAP